MKNLLIIFALCCCGASFATTWDEPWQKDIIQKANLFVYAEVVTCADSAMEIRVVKSFSDPALVGQTLPVSDFFMLELCSFSEGHGPEFHFAPGMRGYVLLKKDADGSYKLPTPTSGFDRVDGGKVYATYRHSYHQALVDSADYELTYNEIWSYYKTGKYDPVKVLAYIDEKLALKPAGFEEDEIATFFQQHVAMEMAYLLDIPVALNRLLPFTEAGNFHSEVSALRVMEHAEPGETSEFLLRYIGNKKKDPFLLVMAIRSLRENGSPEQLAALRKMSKKLADDSVSFGGNIMDPRVCTHLPSPRESAGAKK